MYILIYLGVLKETSGRGNLEVVIFIGEIYFYFKKLVIVTYIFISASTGKNRGGKKADVFGVIIVNYLVKFF